jgi:hypothetical protein
MDRLLYPQLPGRKITMPLIKNLAIATALLLGASTAQAVTITLSDEGDFGTIDGAYFVAPPPDYSSGTGTLDTFLRIAAKGSGTSEFGMNTTDAPGDTKAGGFLETSLLLANIGTVAIGGTDFYEFLVDANEFQNTPEAAELDLTEFQVYLSSSADLSSADILGSIAASYDLDGVEDSTVTFSTLNSGSGRADLQILVPLTALDPESTYVYVLAGFDRVGSGFEELNIRLGDDVPAPPLPEPATALLLGAGLLGLARLGRRS